MIKVGIIGVTGYAGIQLLWLLENHPNVEVTMLASRSYEGMDLAEVYPNFQGRRRQILLSDDALMSRIDELDCLFMALPHGLSQPLAQKAHDHHVKVIDLGADFRFDDLETYEKWYKVKHESKILNDRAVYGLCELYREEIKQSDIVASPGCFPTSAILGAAPLLNAKLVNPKTIIVDSKSGTTGAGRGNKTASLFCEVNESFKAYGVFSHRHRPEIEQELSHVADESVEIVFTPHLIPINRGILSTIYLDLNTHQTEADLLKLYQDFYQGEAFVRVRESLPELSHVKGTNFCDIAIRVDEERQKVIVISAIDNLIKGAAGQAVQSMNIMHGLDETLGLKLTSMYI
ncbi:N-acetyl-gamma-glutamyl-phosphate reductase [Ignatzschineria sp. RMDPL8A]|uniref:N-acetyl-gamma-glutamyl-phosphate reductase n=1 Tax=Ignatzschineria sp. RMDPL8A TaxID=2999236 RepID=UPI002446677B|nr:N-acetyl-gamma-glutamyl-phosphate reductase [Ignatzschineria sp. RMDPL8A]MDG9730167.1 N-acetyl-gamma-glutamyl-phosphate reductase [Ignatzschineria sp. RMDPL8A]